MEWLQACYFDDHKNRQVIDVSHLTNKKVFQLAQENTLFDVTEQVRLFPVNGDVRRSPYFRAASDPRRSILLFENDLEHNALVKQIIDKLEKRTRWKILRSIWDQATQQVTVRTFFTLDDYRWEKEVHRIVDSDAIVRHDIFGQDPSTARMSIFRPWVAIEIIHSHYPDEKAYQAFLEVSKRMPLIVLFDATKAPNALLKQSLKEGRLKPVYYIFEGSVWKNQKKVSFASASDFCKEVDEYVNKTAEKRRQDAEKDQ